MKPQQQRVGLLKKTFVTIFGSLTTCVKFAWTL